MNLPPLPLEEWRPTKDTVHLWAQIVGKVRLAHMPRRNHFWHTPLYVSARGLTTGRIPVRDTSVEVALDLVGHELVVTTTAAADRFDLHDGLSVADFYRRLMQTLDGLGVPTSITPKPYGVPMTTPFPDDAEHATYDTDAVSRFHTVLTFADTVMQEFAGWFSGKASPVHVFWHSFDVAHTRYWWSLASSEQEIAFGFWPGDDTTPAPTFYAYTAPEPAGLAQQPLRPEAATWFLQPSGATAHLGYDAVRQAADPRGAVLEFFQSAYEAGARLGGWDIAGLTTDWCPFQPAAQGDPDG